MGNVYVVQHLLQSNCSSTEKSKTCTVPTIPCRATVAPQGMLHSVHVFTGPCKVTIDFETNFVHRMGKTEQELSHCAIGLFYSFASVFGQAHKPEQVTSKKLCRPRSFNYGNVVTDHARQRFAVEQPDHSMKMIPPQVRHRLFAKNVSAKNGGVPRRRAFFNFLTDLAGPVWQTDVSGTGCLQIWGFSAPPPRPASSLQGAVFGQPGP